MPAEITSALHAVLRTTEIDTIILGIVRLARAAPQFIAVLTAILAHDKRSRASRAMTVLKILRQDYPPLPAPEIPRPGTRTATHRTPTARTRNRQANKRHNASNQPGEAAASLPVR